MPELQYTTAGAISFSGADPVDLEGVVVTGSHVGQAGSVWIDFGSGSSVGLSPTHQLLYSTVPENAPSDAELAVAQYVATHQAFAAGQTFSDSDKAHLAQLAASAYTAAFSNTTGVQLPDPNGGPPTYLSAGQLQNLVMNTTWRLDNTTGQPGGVGANIDHNDGTFTANFVAAGLNKYVNLGEDYVTFIGMHEIAHETSAGLAYRADMFAQYNADPDASTFGPDSAYWLNAEVWANNFAKNEMTSEGGIPPGDPTDGYIFHGFGV